MTIDELMQIAPVIPVLVIEDPADAVAIAEALVDGGLTVLEVTLRTPAALEVIREMAKVDGAIVGTGTVLSVDQMDAALEAGARFIVSPGLTAPLAAAAKARATPFLPGVATAGDLMRGVELGLDRFKFFPAEAAGGLLALRALAAPFGAARFCPTGGVTEDTAPVWLAEPSVKCVGGSWLVPKGAPNLAAIRAAAARASALRPVPAPAR